MEGVEIELIEESKEGQPEESKETNSDEHIIGPFTCEMGNPLVESSYVAAHADVASNGDEDTEGSVVVGGEDEL